MGNTPSSEAPRKRPQKLSKPRPASRLFDLAPERSPLSDLSSPRDSRYGDDYLAASRRPLSYHPQSSPSHGGPLDSPGSASSTPLRSPRRPLHAYQPPPLSDSHPPLPPPTSPTELGMNGRLTRANTVVYPAGASIPSLTRAYSYSFHSNAQPSGGMRAQSSMNLAARRRHSKLDLLRRRSSYLPSIETDLPTSPCEETSSGSARSLDSESHLSSPGSPTVSSYIPMRRRSLYQTPGVATRATRDYPPSPIKPAVHIIQPPPEDQLAYEPSTHSDADSSLMLQFSGPEVHDRPVTPCEAHYRQLGGIEFGTLRITNGSPIPSPAAESDDGPVHDSALISISSEPHPHTIVEPFPPVKAEETSNGGPSPDDGLKVVGSGLEFQRTSQMSLNVAGATISVQNNPPVFRPMGPDQEDAARMTPGSPSSGYSSRGRQTSPGPIEAPAARGPSDVEYISPEVLDVRQDPHAKPQLNEQGSRPCSKSRSDPIVRTDSGFVSNSTSSRQSSQKTLDKTDSGYGSNFSLRSIRSNSTNSHGSADKAKLSPKSTFPTEEKPSSENDVKSRLRRTPSSRSSFSLMSRDRLRRLSTRSSKKSKPSSPVSDELPVHCHIGPASVDVVECEEAQGEARRKMPDGNSGKQGKLSRFLSGSRKQGRAATVVSHHEVPDSVPAIPINLEEKLYGRLDQPPSVPKKDAPWARVEQQPLQTIISTESLDLVDHDSRAQSSPQVLLQARQPQPPASAPATSTSSHERKPSSGSLSDAPIKRKPVGSAPRHASGNEGWHQAFPGNGFPDVVEEEDDEKYGSGMTSTPATGASEAPRARNMRAKSKPSTPTRLTRARTLDSRSSAPNLAASFETLPRPPLPQADAQDGISPWPLEMRTRALKTARDMLPSQTSSVTAEPVSSLSRSNSRERLHSYHWLPSQTKNAEAAVVGAPPPPMRHSYSAHGRHPPVVYRRAHGRQDNDEQGHQYRILHSYNSPAYKHVPIWS